MSADEPDAAEAARSRPVAPHFVVAVVNDETILRCVISPGAAMVVSDTARLPNRLEASAAAGAPAPALPAGFVRILLYSPNLVTDDYPNFAWDADLDIDGTVFFIGSIHRRCEVTEKRFVLPAPPRNVQLRVHRLRSAPIRSTESEALAQRVLELLQDTSFNPRGGSVPLQRLAEEAHRRFAHEFRLVVGAEHLGSFRGFVQAHSSRFSVFHYHESEIESRRMSNVSPFDERVAIRKGVRESLPPLMPFGNNEQEVVDLITDALKDHDSHVHVLMRELSKHEVFRVSMAPGFSSLMHWLQKHRDTFRWSTDPQSVCIIGLVKNAPSDPSTLSRDPAQSPGDAAAAAHPDIGSSPPGSDSGSRAELDDDE